jgi:diacylglycerol kinase (ATP)
MAFRLSKRASSFRHALRGIALVVRTQHNAWIHLVATGGVIVAGWLLAVTRAEWAALIFAIGLVWTAEALNTAIEFLSDEVSLEKRERIGAAKDAGAGAVLLASIIAAVIGVVVFVPHLRAFVER